MEPSVQADDVWDAGDMGCGELVFLLAQRTRALGPGKVLELVATDLGAPHDIPAWCRLTGNRLLVASPPHYFIRSKES
jgi:tRNA 2-thiouridine synthesizing protein A